MGPARRVFGTGRGVVSCMAVTVGSNIASLRAQAQLGKVSDEIAISTQRLSSGLRINVASDDAAGLAVSSTLRTDARIYTQAVRNANDAISAFSIAGGALEQLTAIAQRLGELAPQAASRTLSGKQRISLDKEARALSAEFNRIVDTTSFNGVTLLTQRNRGLAIQLGQSAVQLSLGFDALGNDGTFQAIQPVSNFDNPMYTVAADFNGDGKLDIATNGQTSAEVQVLIGNGDGTFRGRVTYFIPAATGGIGAADFNNDGAVDLVGDNYLLYGNGDGTFRAAVTLLGAYGGGALNIADLNGDGVADVISASNTSVPPGVNKVDIFLGNSSGGFDAVSVHGTPTLLIDDLALQDLNGDGRLDMVTVGRNSDSIGVSLGNGDGTFQLGTAYTVGDDPRSLQVADFNNDGILDAMTGNYVSQTLSLLLGRGDGTFSSATTLAIAAGSLLPARDFNRDGFTDIVAAAAGVATLMFGNGDGTFSVNGTFTYGFAEQWGDFNNDGIDDVYVTNNVGLRLGNGNYSNVSVASLKILPRDLELWSQYGAKKAIPYLEKLRTALSRATGSLGAMESRVQAGRRVAETLGLGATQAASRIQDVDVAEEAGRLVSRQILQAGCGGGSFPGEPGAGVGATTLTVLRMTAGHRCAPLRPEAPGAPGALGALGDGSEPPRPGTVMVLPISAVRRLALCPTPGGVLPGRSAQRPENCVASQAW